MESRTKLLGHPVHPMLVVFPLGLLATGVIFDILYLAIGNENFAVASYWMISAGIVGGLLAAIFGLMDWLGIPGGTRAKTIGLWHGAGNAVIVVLFLVSWWMRRGAPDHVPGVPALLPSFLGAALAAVTGWLGGELVYRLNIGVDPGANPNASSSLSGGPAETYREAKTPRQTGK